MQNKICTYYPYGKQKVAFIVGSIKLLKNTERGMNFTDYKLDKK